MVTAVPGITRRRTSCSTMSVSPIIVSSQNAWSLQDVRFTDAECSDYILRFCKKYFGGMNQEDALCLEQYVRNMTKGHPGLVAFFMGSIRVQEGIVSMLYIPTEHMLADIFTKGLHRTRHQTHCRLIGIPNVASTRKTGSFHGQ